MRDEYINRGEILPKIFPAGSNNPMGLYALYLEKNYAIHGTNTNFGIGLRVTRGCIRLRPKDIAYLFQIIPVGTKVRFINEPIKSTVESDGMQYLEIHNPLACEITKYDTNSVIIEKLTKRVHSILHGNNNFNYEVIHKTIQERSGMPVKITYSKKDTIIK